jgi:hypothetical protein
LLNLHFPFCSWPRDGEEWKRLLAKAAPWLTAAAIVAAAVVAGREVRSLW